jgi:hypothetical protein
MTLQDKVEDFFSKGDVITFAMDNEDVVMTLLFNKQGFHTFSQNENYENMYAYFNGRKIKMILIPQTNTIKISFIDIKSGDALNIENVKFVTDNFGKFLDTVKENKHISFTIMGLSEDGSTMIMPEIMLKNKPLKIRGYSLANIT